MLVGYARTSTLEQEAGLAAQVRDLKRLGCEKIFKEQVSALGTRTALDAAIEFCREGDTLVVTKLDRLARSVRHMWEVLDCLRVKSVAVRIENLGIDTGTSTGKLMLNILGGVAEFEREMMLERQREGIDLAHVLALHDDFEVSKDAAARAYAQYHSAMIAVAVVHDGKILRVYRPPKFPRLSVGEKQPVPRSSVYWRAQLPGMPLSDIVEGQAGQWLESEWGKKLPVLYEQVLHQQMKYALVMLWPELEEADEDYDPDEDRTSKQRLGAAKRTVNATARLRERANRPNRKQILSNPYS